VHLALNEQTAHCLCKLVLELSVHRLLWRGECLNRSVQTVICAPKRRNPERTLKKETSIIVVNGAHNKQGGLSVDFCIWETCGSYLSRDPVLSEIFSGFP
jgi:hypothetical protein